MTVDPRLIAIPDVHGHAKGEHKPFADERPIPYSARLIFLWFYHAARRGGPRFLMISDHSNYLTFEDPAAVNLARRALKLALAGDIHGAAETAGVDRAHASVVSDAMRAGSRFSIGAEVDNDPRSRPDAQAVVDAMKPDAILRTVHFLPIAHPETGVEFFWPFDNPEFKQYFDIVGVEQTWQQYSELLAEVITTLPTHIVPHLYVPGKFGHWPSDEIVEAHEDRILAICAERDFAIEINARVLYSQQSAELHEKHLTAYRRLLKKAVALDVGIAIGSDAHSPRDQGRGFDRLLPLLDEAGINEIVFPVQGRLAAVALRADKATHRPPRKPKPPGPIAEAIPEGTIVTESGPSASATDPQNDSEHHASDAMGSYMGGSSRSQPDAAAQVAAEAIVEDADDDGADSATPVASDLVDGSDIVVGDADSMIGGVDTMMGDVNSMMGDADTMIGDVNTVIGDETTANDDSPTLATGSADVVAESLELSNDGVDNDSSDGASADEEREIQATDASVASFADGMSSDHVANDIPEPKAKRAAKKARTAKFDADAAPASAEPVLQSAVGQYAANYVSHDDGALAAVSAPLHDVRESTGVLTSDAPVASDGALASGEAAAAEYAASVNQTSSNSSGRSRQRESRSAVADAESIPVIKGDTALNQAEETLDAAPAAVPSLGTSSSVHHASPAKNSAKSSRHIASPVRATEAATPVPKSATPSRTVKSKATADAKSSAASRASTAKTVASPKMPSTTKAAAGAKVAPGTKAAKPAQTASATRSASAAKATTTKSSAAKSATSSKNGAAPKASATAKAASSKKSTTASTAKSAAKAPAKPKSTTGVRAAKPAKSTSSAAKKTGSAKATPKKAPAKARR